LVLVLKLRKKSLALEKSLDYITAFLGVKTYCDPSYIFLEVQNLPTPGSMPLPVCVYVPVKTTLLSACERLAEYACGSRYDVWQYCFFFCQVSDTFNVGGKSGPVEHDCGKVPALGLSWANSVTTRLMLSRTEQYVTVALRDSKDACPEQCSSMTTPRMYEANVRHVQVLFAPHLPNSVCRFIVDEDGVKGLPADGVVI